MRYVINAYNNNYSVSAKSLDALRALATELSARHCGVVSLYEQPDNGRAVLLGVVCVQKSEVLKEPIRDDSPTDDVERQLLLF